MAPGSAPQWCPPVRDVDRLELLRAGALGGRRVLGPEAGSVRIGVPDLAGDPGQLELVDTEGVPLGIVHVSRDEAGHAVLVGEPTWLGRRSSRPFERLHQPPTDFDTPAPTCIVDVATPPAEIVAHVLTTPGSRVLLLGSVAGDGTGRVVQAIRAAAISLADLDATLVVVPASDSSDDDAIARAYAHGGPVTVMRGDETPVVATERGVVVLLTGLSGSGKSTIARAVRDHMLETSDVPVSLLDGDEVRRHLSAGLTFSVADRDANVRRIGWVAAEISHHGGVAICSPIAPFDRTRRDVRELVEGRGGRLLLVHVATPVAECERRDRKGLYAKARAGLIPDFTGISSPYEAPHDADLVIDTTGVSIQDARDRVLDMLSTIPGAH